MKLDSVCSRLSFSCAASTFRFVVASIIYSGGYQPKHFRFTFVPGRFGIAIPEYTPPFPNQGAAQWLFYPILVTGGLVYDGLKFLDKKVLI
jgi:hypothetical protein